MHSSISDPILIRGMTEMEAFYLEAALHLGPQEEKDVLFCFDKRCSEDSMVSRHPSFTEPEIKLVGEMGDGGDHMYVSFKNLTDHPVTIEENTAVVQLYRGNQEDCPLSSTDGRLNLISSNQEDPVEGSGGDLPMRGVDNAGDFFMLIEI